MNRQKPYVLKHKITGLYLYKGTCGITLREKPGKIYTTDRNYLSIYGDKYKSSNNPEDRDMYTWFDFHYTDPIFKKYPILLEYCNGYDLKQLPGQRYFPLKTDEFEKEYLK